MHKRDEHNMRTIASSFLINAEMMKNKIENLSEGQKGLVAFARLVLQEPALLILDEPTNHLDQFAIKWLVDYLKGLTRTTCLIVSHDTRFLDAVCTNITHYENMKLKFYRGNLSDFVKQKPEAKQYYELTNDNVSFNFPEPGPLEGVKSLTKSVLKMKNCYFQYPTALKPQLIDVNIQVSMASRVAIVGVNGAGKSTLIKILVGELEPNKGIIERHPNVRVAYVAQHAFHHIENHLDKTPVEYIMWRYRAGYDKEQTSKDSLTLSEEELLAIKQKAKENEEEISRISLSLQQSTKLLCRNLQDNPNLEGNLEKIDEERANLEKLLTKTQLELQTTATMETLRRRVEKEQNGKVN
jgi:elongation factor 3